MLLLHKLDLLLPLLITTDLMKQFIPVFKDHVNYSKENSIYILQLLQSRVENQRKNITISY